MVSGDGGIAGGTRRVALLSQHGGPWLRQTDDGAGRHGAIAVGLAAGPQDDWLVVYDDIAAPVETSVPPSRRILFVTEPPDFKRCKTAFANQFGVLVSPYEVERYRGRWIASQSALPWFYGLDFDRGQVTSRMGFADLRDLPVPSGKQRRISVVCSTKARLAGHRARLDLLRRLTTEFPDSIDVFGRGFKPVGDKADIIAPYRYHLVMENNSCPHFWTEKLADAYLGYSLPIFVGCSNVTDYFPERSMVRIADPADHGAAVRLVAQVLDADPWEERLDDIIAARRRLIEHYNLFSVIERLTGEMAEQSAGGTAETIWPAKKCGPLRSALRAAGQAIGRPAQSL